jgi:hypothetical protein
MFAIVVFPCQFPVLARSLWVKLIYGFLLKLGQLTFLVAANTTAFYVYAPRGKIFLRQSGKY